MEPAWLDGSAYPFEHRYVDVRAGRMHYVDEGQGEPALFVHGTPTWSFEYRHLISALSPHLRCIAPDLVGFGLSSRPSTFAYTPEAHAGALAEFVDRLNLERVSLVVHDFGGPIGLPLCLDGTSRVVRLVIMIFAFGPRFLARWEQLLPQARVLRLADAGHWPHEEAPEEVARAIRAFSLQPA